MGMQADAERRKRALILTSEGIVLQLQSTHAETNICFDAQTLK